MNKHQKLVQQQFLNNEQQVIDRLEWVYKRSQKDVDDKIKNLQFKIDGLQQTYDWMDDNDPEKAKIKSMIQSKIYQKQYQEQLKSQIDGILNEMQTKQFLTVSDYLDDCYTDGFVGTIFDAHGQGVPIITPIDQQSLVRAVQLDSKISKGLYTRLGEDITKLKKRIASHVSRGISSGMSYGEVANALKGCSKVGYNNAIRIARTEGHRIQTTAAMDAMTAAKHMGADVVKQWDSTLDARTRESHAIVDGEIRELDKPFSNGLDYPGDPSGKAAEVINCRCALLQRARWALGDDELQTLQDRAAYYGLDKTANFEDFKAKYLKAVENPVVDVDDVSNAAKILTNSVDDAIISYRNFVDGDEINQFFYYDDYANNSGLLARKNGDYGKWLSGLSSDEKDAVCWYAADGYGDINSYLRKKDGWESIPSDIIEDAIGNIDNTISRFTLKDNISVQRGAMEDSLDDIIETYGINDLSELVGKTYNDKAYMSTTVMVGNQVATAKPVVFDIEIPKGKGRGAYINKIAGAFEDTEYEFLIKRDARFTITDVTEDVDTAKTYVKMVMNDD